MKTQSDVEALERLIVQLDGLHNEISQLTKKSPNDAMNNFKLKLINNVLETANTVLGDKYRPFIEFDQFDSDDMPTNSDVTLILTQYIEQTERFRSDHVTLQGIEYYYMVDGKPSNIKAKRPSQIGYKK